LSCDGTTCELGSSDYCQNCESCEDGVCNCEENVCECPIDCEEAEAEEAEPELEKGTVTAALALTLKSIAKKWYVWLLLWIVFVVLLYTIFKRSKAS